MLLRVFTGDGGDFRSQQAHDDTVFIGGPRRAVKAQEGGPGALFAAETKAAVVQPVNKPLEANRHFYQLAAQIVHHAVNHRGGDQRFTYRYLFAPLRTMLEQVVDRHCQVVVRVHQPCRGNDAVTVIVWIVSKGQIELVAQRQQASHRTLGGAVHTDRAIFVEVHKAEGLIDLIVNDGQIQLVEFGNAFPVLDTGAAQRIDAQLQPGFLDRGHVDDLGQPFDKRLNQIFLGHAARGHGFVKRHALNPFQARRQQSVGTIFDDPGHIGVGWPPVRRVIFDAAIFRRVVRRGNDDAVSLRAALLVVLEDSIRYRRRWRIAVVLLHDDIDAVGSQHFQHGDKRRLGERVSILTDIARPGDAVFSALFSNRLRNSQNVRFVEAMAYRTAAVAGGAKFYRMFAIAHFRLQHVVLRGKLSDVNQIALLCRLSCAFMICHCLILLMQGLDCAANLINQLHRELHRLHDMLHHAAFAVRIRIRDHPVWRICQVLRFGLRPVLQQRLLIAGKVNTGTAVQGLRRLGKRFLIQ